ncbi:MAG: CopG family antitoxin [Candidatus Curtissbacteria bacterium]|nr:CopG family antitoxin [Candidatus Curtissbacteria bacterium]
MKKKKRKLPDFNKMSYEEEATWWDTHDLGDYWGEFKDVDIVFDLKKPRDETLIVRLQKDIKDKLELVARNRGINMSTLARMWLLEKLRESQAK